ncbi:MAG: DUF2304 domain-containing protein [Lysobacteraceae bacterium]
MTPLLTAALLGVGTALVILYLVRRDQMHGRYAFWWLSVATVALVFGLMPSLVDRLGHWFGVKYPPTLVVMLVLAALLVKLLVSDLDVTRRERRIRRLLQKTAILEAELRELRTEVDALRNAASHSGDESDVAAAVVEPPRKVVG